MQNSGEHQVPQTSHRARPYMLTGGRTVPAVELGLESRVATTGNVAPEKLNLEHAKAWQLCQYPTAVVEIAGKLGRPVAVTKILLADLIKAGAATTLAANLIEPSSSYDLLERVLRELKKL
ncbi:DUF742 domain-containing protein [Amycolatopsis sp. NPDC023774]|uniref:DUF742 domain-containing protein n=1 Tax=Amycolatopsis sp. NPDC023774 TaxID=3155015 RepID=UPI0034019EFB